MKIKDIRILEKRRDGGPESTVMGYWLIEWKAGFSIALLCFGEGSREAYHSHAFDCISWLLTGGLREVMVDNKGQNYVPSFKPILTYRRTFHKVYGKNKSNWLITFRGPWTGVWSEISKDGVFSILSNGRKVLKKVRSV